MQVFSFFYLGSFVVGTCFHGLSPLMEVPLFLCILLFVCFLFLFFGLRG